jgi:hypothetical protein
MAPAQQVWSSQQVVAIFIWSSTEYMFRQKSIARKSNPKDATQLTRNAKMNCQSIVIPDDDFDDDRQCESKAQFRVSSDAGWSGIHCEAHTINVVRNMLSQVQAAGYTMHIEKV